MKEACSLRLVAKINAVYAPKTAGYRPIGSVDET